MEIVAEVLSQAFSLSTIGMAIIGVILGTILGAIPGLSATMGIGLLLSFSYWLDPVSAVIFFTAMYKGGLFGGSIAAILFNTPGTPAAAATQLDGYKLCQKGQARKAIRMALIASVIGDFFGTLVLISISKALANFALKFGPPEFAALVVLAFVTIIGLSKGSLMKGLAATALGVFVSTIGFDPETATPRLAFGNSYLSSGLDLVPVLVGMLAVSEIFNQIEKLKSQGELPKPKGELDQSRLTFREVWQIKRTLLRSSAIGTFIGALPGLGPTLAAFMGYNEAKRKSKQPESFGTGNIEGVAAAEAANSAVGGSNLIPLLSLGIPGDAEAAMILSVLVIHGIIPGPRIFETNGVFLYVIFIGFILAILFNLLINWFASRYVAKISYVSIRMIIPVVLITSVLGVYAVNQRMFDVYVMFIFALLGYVMHKFEYPTISFIIGFILGPIFETSFRQTMIMSEGNLGIFIERPISIGIFVLVVIILSRNIRQLLAKA